MSATFRQSSAFHAAAISRPLAIFCSSLSWVVMV